MQVVCNQCHAVCEVDADSFASPSSALTCDECSAPLALPAVEIGTDTTWLVLMPKGQTGPYNAAQMAELMDHASIDWGSLIWRAGLKGWRPARRDPTLVTSIASAQGAGAYGDTRPLALRPRSFLPNTDTVVEPLRRAFARRGSDDFSIGDDHYSHEVDDAFTKVTHRVPPADSRRGAEARAYAREPNVEARAYARDQNVEARLAADALRTIPTPTPTPTPPPRELREPMNPDTQPVLARASSPTSWLPTLQSMSMVAIVAFAFGVLAAALWGRYVVRHEQRAATVLVRPAPPPVPTTEPVRSASTQGVGTALPLDVHSLSTHVMNEQPADAELRREVHRVSPDVRRCIDDRERGAEVEIYFVGQTGKVSEAKVRTEGLSSGAVECLTNALQQMQIDPFQRESYRFWHRFSY